MSWFVIKTGLALCLWILASIALAIALLLLSVFESKREEFIENIIYPEGSFTAAVVNSIITPQERLRRLEKKIKSKKAELEMSREKLEETRRTLSELEVSTGEAEVKYQELLRQLQTELSKSDQNVSIFTLKKKE